VYHRAHVFLVDAHAPGAGSRQYRPRVAVEPGFDLELFFLLESGMVEAYIRVAEALPEQLRRALGAAAGCAKDYQRPLSSRSFQNERAFLGAAADDAVLNIRSVAA